MSSTDVTNINSATNKTILDQPFLQFIKQELSTALTSKDILVYEFVKQLENNNIRTFEVFKELDSDDVDEILDSLVSINENTSLKKMVLIQVKILVNKVQEEFKTKDPEFAKGDNTNDYIHMTEQYLEIDSKLDHVITQFNDFKERLYNELPTNNATDPSNNNGNNNNNNAPTPPALTPAVSMTTITPYHSTNKQTQQPNIQTPNAEEPFRQLKASKQDSSQKILMNAMIKHDIPLSKLNEYVLIISYQDKEIIMTKDDKPVEIFKNLKKNGYQPAIMLREIDKVNFALNYEGEETPGGRL
ncbi:hypothetical protein HANVADRAFT_2772 [Hanseniaspora valbyensis NRRL Y-1626]|uniref:Ras-associating domain-containing protein n=1 Tax=Hanseniaspora valbyensis NRRL Y-1626 TaxID=766949 RepID=A0A1B7TCD2_9ASCO|nr:hypothetical protein HANVADRAFT_2772 [Hanseniaspora valbyensis NRRL Y-1626]